MNAYKFLLITVLSAILSLSNSSSVYADDTDIYLDSTGSTTANDVLPKVLIILDNSGSMESNTILVAGAYDPATTYTGSWDSSKVYWTTGSSAPTDATTTQFFSKTNLKCDSALAAFASATGGHYDNDVIFMWAGTDADGHWGKLTDLHAVDATYDNYVDCKNDQSDSAYYAGGASSKSYFDRRTDTNNGTFAGNAYTNTYNQRATTSTFYTNFENLYLWDGNYLNAQEGGVLGSRTLTRMQVAQEAVDEILTTTNGVAMGLMSFNPNNSGGEDGGSIVMAVNTLDSTQRTKLKTVVDSLSGYFNGVDYTDGQYYTPLAESLYEAYRYFAGLTPDMGGRSSLDTTPATYTDPRPMSDYCAQDTSSSSQCAPYASGVARSTVQGYFPSAGSTQPSYISPLANSCEKAYVIIVTDGDPFNDDDRDTQIDALVNGATYSTTAVTGSTSSSSDRLDDLAGYLSNNDISPLSGDQTVVTYTVGFGTGITTSGRNLLKRTAGVGGGTYLTADDITTLSNTLRAIFFSISSTSSSFAAPSLSVNAFNKLYNRDEIYFSLFKPHLYQRWAGNIKKFKLCTSAQETAGTCTYGELIDSANAPAIDITTHRIKDSSVSYWNSGTDGGDVEAGGAGKVQYDAGYAARRMYTYLGTYTGLSASSPATPIAVDSGSSSTFFQAIDTGSSGDPTILGLPATASAADVTNLIDWMRGKDSYDEDGDATTTQRWTFGDPLHSSPIALTFGAIETSPGVYDYDQPIIKLLVATNDGVVRLIDEDSGAEQWSFVPKEILKEMKTLATNTVGDHIYGIDSTISIYVKDVDNDGLIEYADGDRVYAFVGMRRGSKDGTNNPVFNNIYAFDMTPTSLLTSHASITGLSPKLMWVIQGGVGDYKMLGQTWSGPKVDTLTVKSGSTNADVVALFFGGGNSTSAETAAVTPTTGAAGNAVFIANAATGARIWWASDPAETDGSGTAPDLGLTDMDYPIPSDLTLLDINADGAVDRMYFGDLGGQVWRIDLDVDINPSGASPAARNGSSNGYVFADLVCPRNGDGTRNCPGTAVNQNWRRMYYRPDHGAVRDTTYVTSGYSDYDIISIATGDRSDPLDKLTSSLVEQPVNNRVYALRDYNIAFGPPATIPVPIVETNLYDATNNDLQSTTASTVAAAKTALTNSKGWYVSFKETSAPAWTASDAIGSRVWIGEKALARTVIFAGVIYVTTFTPANQDTATLTCVANEGLGQLYALNAIDATAVVDLTGNGVSRSVELGGGIPSELVTVIREDGTVGVVGGGGGETTVNVNNEGATKRTYWIQE